MPSVPSGTEAEGVTMGSISSSDRRLALVGLALILLLASALRFFNIGWSFSSNGVDEGIMLERSVMVGHGYPLYSALPSDQAPLAFYVGAILGGDVLTLRSFVAAVSIAAIAASMIASRRLGGTRAMLVTGMLLAVDFALLRESRLFSLDALSASFLAFSVLPFLLYIGKGSRTMLAFSGLLIGLSTMFKLLGVLGLIGMLAFMVLEMRSSRERTRRSIGEMAVLVVSAGVPVAIAMAVLGVGPMIQGMVLDQGHRGYDLGVKLSIAAFFGLNLAYVIPLVRARAIWRVRPENRYLLSVSFVLLAFMLVQPLTFLHHMVMLSFPLAILAGPLLFASTRGDGEEVSRSARMTSSRILLALAIAGILVSSGLGIYGLAEQRRPIQEYYATQVDEWTDPGAWVVSGDPLITAYAHRLTPPELVNVAFRQYPDLTEQELESAILKYNVSVVVVCYRLNEMAGLPSFLIDHGYTERLLEPLGSEPVLNLFESGIEPIHFYVHGPFRILDVPSSGSLGGTSTTS